MAKKKKVTKKKASSAASKKTAKKSSAKKASPKKAVKKTASSKKTTKKASKKVTSKKTKSPAKKAAPKKEEVALENEAIEEVVTKQEESQKKLSPKDERRNKAAEALKAALEESSSEGSAEEEFDPEAFFAASGNKGIFRSHIMRKERVDLNVLVRYRKPRDPIVHNAELINLSKGGLALRTDEIIDEEVELRIEIPLPHTSELFRIMAKVIWSHRMEAQEGESEIDMPIHTGMTFMPMSLAKQSVISSFIQQRRDELIMAKIGLDKFADSVPVAGLD